MKKQKRIVAIHDISCLGKCSLTVALPILSSVGIEVCVIPTAVLSTNTGSFTGFTYHDLTEEIEPIIDHWKTLGVNFDALYSGFLGSLDQLEIVSRFFDYYKRSNNLVLVDPVMGDNGKLYSVYSDEYPMGMKKLCSKADIIVPNITEASFLVGENYVEGPYNKEYIDSLLKKLTALGPQKAIVTGVYFNNQELGAAGYDAVTDKIHYAFAKSIKGYYSGTGDIFASSFLAATLSGNSLEYALKIAVDFTSGSIARTRKSGTDIRLGVNFEEGLKKLIQDCEQRLF